MKQLCPYSALLALCRVDQAATLRDTHVKKQACMCKSVCITLHEKRPLYKKERPLASAAAVSHRLHQPLFALFIYSSVGSCLLCVCAFVGGERGSRGSDSPLLPSDYEAEERSTPCQAFFGGGRSVRQRRRRRRRKEEREEDAREREREREVVAGGGLSLLPSPQ